jgi:two-component system, NarL family, sensor histidine kinase DesK
VIFSERNWIEGSAWSPRQARWLLVAAHLPFVLTSPIYAITGLDGPRARYPVVPLVAGLAIGAIQLRHSLAASRRERPRGWVWTFLALILLVYVPMPWFTGNWIDLQLFVVVSAIMLLRGPLRMAVMVLPGLSTVAVVAADAPLGYSSHGYPALLVVASLWLGAGFAIGIGATYGAVWLVRVVDELSATRTELAEMAIGRERLRVSRDLHDLLGQSLAAVSLKGDLALRLLSRDSAAARAQVENLTSVARDALVGMRAVTHDKHAVSLTEETVGVTGLLAAAGIEATVDIRLPDLTPAVSGVLAWAVREGVTNVLRHTDATRCSLTAFRRAGSIRLEIVNDGVSGPMSKGSGLAGLTERARVLAGTVTADSADGSFRLLVEIPEETR